jgi:hypothetical protein
MATPIDPIAPARANGRTAGQQLPLTRPPLRLSCSWDETHFACTIDHPETLRAITRFSSPQQGIAELMRIGAAGITAAAAGFDADGFGRQLDAAIAKAKATLTHHEAQLSTVVGGEGPLAATIAGASARLRGDLDTVFRRQTDPDTQGSLLARLQGALQAFDATMAKAVKDVGGEVRETADRQARLVSQSVQQLQNLDPASALGQAISGIRTELQDIREVLAANEARTTERLLGTAKGHDFEALLTETVGRIACVHGDVAEHTGDQPGLLASERAASKRGDVTVTVYAAPAYPTMVIEGMNRAAPTAKAVQAELAEAMRNRDADVAIAVTANPTHAILCGQPIKPLGPNMWVTILDPNDPDPCPLQMAYLLARHTAIAAHAVAAEIDATAAIDEAIEDVNRILTTASELKSQLANVGTWQERAAGTIDKLYGELRRVIQRLQSRLEEAAA